MRPRRMGRSTGDRRIVVIGAGNPYRGDDAVGVAFSRRIREVTPEEITVLESNGDPARLIEAWSGASAVFLVDAVHAGSTGGIGNTERIFCFEAHRDALPTEFFRVSTHAIGVAEGIELARALGRMPPRFVVYGVRGDRFDYTTELSPAVDRACDEVVRRVLGDIRELIDKHD